MKGVKAVWLNKSHIKTRVDSNPAPRLTLGLLEARQAGLAHHHHRLDCPVDTPVPVIHRRGLQGLDTLAPHDIDLKSGNLH